MINWIWLQLGGEIEFEGIEGVFPAAGGWGGLWGGMGGGLFAKTADKVF